MYHLGKLQILYHAYQEVFFENGSPKVAAWNNTISTLKETQKELYTVKDLYCQMPVKSGRQLNRTAILKILVYWLYVHLLLNLRI